MYHTPIPIHFQWPYNIPTTNVHGAIARSNSPVFITGCNELFLPMERFTSPTLCAIPTNRILTTVDISNLRSAGQKCFKELPKLAVIPSSPLPKTKDGPIKLNLSPPASTTGSSKLETVVKEHLTLFEDRVSSSARGQKRQHEEVSNNLTPAESPIQPKKLKSVSEMGTDESNVSDNAEKMAISLSEGQEKLVLEVLSQKIWNFYKKHQQTEEMFERKMRLREALFKILRGIYPCCGLYIVGSSLTQIGLDNSDLDLCLMLTHKEIDQETEATSILSFIYDKIANLNFITQPQVIQAKVPILKFVDNVSGVEVDLNINNAVGIRNTQLIHCYSRLDWRFAPLSVTIKLWARQHNINDARNMTLSSYSLILMLVHFLQCGIEPPVLPCLQKLLSDKFNPLADVRNLTLREDLPDFHSNNKMNLAELLMEFFNYFGNKFDFSNDVMSVRTGGKLAKHVAMNGKSPKNRRGQWKYICIEEPMERTNTARSVFNDMAFSRIVSAFKNSYSRLSETKDLNSVVKLQLR